MGEGAFYFFFDLLSLWVERVACVLPLFGLDVDDLIGGGIGAYAKAMVVDFDYFAYHAVKVVFVGVVFDEHDLCALLECEDGVGGVGLVGEAACYLGFVGEGWRRELLEFV